MRRFVVRFKKAMSNMYSVEILDSESGKDFAGTGFTTISGIEERLRAKYPPDDVDTKIPEAIAILEAKGGRELEFDARNWGSWEDFRDFWYAGIPKKNP